MTCSD